MTSIASIQKGLANYLDKELMPLIPSSEKGKKVCNRSYFIPCNKKV